MNEVMWGVTLVGGTTYIIWHLYRLWKNRDRAEHRRVRSYLWWGDA